jgi:plastocyanin
MTLLWRICFSLLLAIAVDAASVKGSVRLENSRDASVTRRNDHSGVVLWLVPAAGVPARPPRVAKATIVQKDKTFTPHILAVEVGATVSFPNDDPIFHNAFSSYDGRIFDLGLYPPGTTRAVKFDRPGIVRVFCNIHSTMSAVIVVTPGPWLAITGPGGDFEIDDVPPGEYTLHVFHERATPETLSALRRQIKAAGHKIDLGRISISEAGYLPLPHKNKYGSDYGPEPDNTHFYSTPRK